VDNARTAEEADLWDSIDVLAGQARWGAVLDLIERHEFDLDPWRMTPIRVRALIGLDWHRRALEHLGKAYGDGYVRGDAAVELLVEWRALALAAQFIDGFMSADLWREYARTSVMTVAKRTCAAASMQDAPLEYADAVQAQHTLQPERETELAVGRALQVLTASAGERLARDDGATAVRLLSAAARLAPADRTILDSLAEAAHQADLTERYFDTLLCIWRKFRDAPALLAAARGVLETASWATIREVMSIAATEADSLGADIGAIAEQYREQARRKVDEYIRVGDIAAGLELVITVSRQFSISDWPDALLSRLLRAAKRRLRDRRAGEALIAALGPPYLEISPLDVDICRMLARVRLRQRRLGDARVLLNRVVANSPHVAGDWIALATVQDEMEDVVGRDLSVARALLIYPDVDLPPALAPVREQLGLL
jgi:hypothetical protein